MITWLLWLFYGATQPVPGFRQPQFPGRGKSWMHAAAGQDGDRGKTSLSVGSELLYWFIHTENLYI